MIISGISINWRIISYMAVDFLKLIGLFIILAEYGLNSILLEESEWTAILSGVSTRVPPMHNFVLHLLLIIRNYTCASTVFKTETYSY